MAGVFTMWRPTLLTLSALLLCLSLLDIPTCGADVVQSLPCVGGWMPLLAQLTDDGGALVVSGGRAPRFYRVDARGRTLQSVAVYYDYGTATQLLLTSDRRGAWLKTAYNVSVSPVNARQAVYLYDSASLDLLANVSAPLFSPPIPDRAQSSWQIAVDAKGALYVAVPVTNSNAVWVFEHSGQGTRQTRYFPIPYSSPLYNFVMAVCRTPQGGEVLWVWGQDSQIVPIRMVALQLSTDGQLLRSQLLPQTFMGQRRTPPASCDPDTGALMVGILNGRELGYVAVNGTAWFTPLALPPVETNSRPSTPGDALYSNDQLIIYGDNLAAIYVYNRRTLAMTGSLYSRVAAVLGASDITALADGSFVLGSASGFYSLGARIDAQAVVLDRLGVYEHNVSTELAYRRLVTADPRNGVVYAVEACDPAERAVLDLGARLRQRAVPLVVPQRGLLVQPCVRPSRRAAVDHGAGGSTGRRCLQGRGPRKRGRGGVLLQHREHTRDQQVRRHRRQPQQGGHGAADAVHAAAGDRFLLVEHQRRAPAQRLAPQLHDADCDEVRRSARPAGGAVLHHRRLQADPAHQPVRRPAAHAGAAERQRGGAAVLHSDGGVGRVDGRRPHRGHRQQRQLRVDVAEELVRPQLRAAAARSERRQRQLGQSVCGRQRPSSSSSSSSSSFASGQQSSALMSAGLLVVVRRREGRPTLRRVPSR